MFGSSSSSPKVEDVIEEPRSPREATKPPEIIIPDGQAANNGTDSPIGRRSEDSPTGRRRGSGMSKIFSGSSKGNSSSPTREKNQTPMQKLGKTDPALSVPQGSLNNAAGESAPGPRSTFRVGVTEDKNKKCRRTMEDTHAYLYNFLSTPAPNLEVPRQSNDLSSTTSLSSQGLVIESDNGYFAIFDGHAGTFAAEWCGKKLHLLLEDNIRKNPNKAIPELLDETFTNVDQQLEKLPLKNSGCTAVIAVLRWEDRIPNSQSATGSSSIAPAAAAAKESADGQDASTLEAKMRETATRQRVLYTANVGDARIVLCRNGKALRLSYDHKGSDDNEGKRIANAGGLILNNRVNGVLAVTRALGDTYMKDLVTGHPYTTETVIQPEVDEFIILACDGLWDVCSDQEAVDLVRNVSDAQEASRMLVEHALARFSTDNLSCMIVRFNVQAVVDAVSSRTEPIGVEGDPPTKVHGAVTEAEAIVGAVRRSMESKGVNVAASPPAETIVESQMENDAQEPGPELDPTGLKRAQDKAKEGQQAVAQK